MKIDDLAVDRFAHPNVVHVAQSGNAGGQRRQRFADFGDARSGGIAAGQDRGRQRLDMGFDLDVRT